MEKGGRTCNRRKREVRVSEIVEKKTYLPQQHRRRAYVLATYVPTSTYVFSQAQNYMGCWGAMKNWTQREREREMKRRRRSRSLICILAGAANSFNKAMQFHDMCTYVCVFCCHPFTCLSSALSSSSVSRKTPSIKPEKCNLVNSCFLPKGENTGPGGFIDIW